MLIHNLHCVGVMSILGVLFTTRNLDPLSNASSTMKGDVRTHLLNLENISAKAKYVYILVEDNCHNSCTKHNLEIPLERVVVLSVEFLKRVTKKLSKPYTIVLSS